MTPQTRLLMVVAVIAGLVLAGCGDDDFGSPADPPGSRPERTTPPAPPTSSTSESPTIAPRPLGGEAAVVLYTVQGLFPVSPPFVGEGPQLALYADGTVLIPSRADAVVAPQVWPYLIGHASPDEVAELIAEAERAGLLAAPPDYGFPVGMSDPPRTTLVLTTAAGSYTHVADGLPADTDDPARLALRAFTGRLTSLAMSAVDDTAAYYEPTRIGVVATPVDAANVVVDWPDDSIDLATATTCTAIEDPATIALLQSSTGGTGYRQAGVIYEIAARVAVPRTEC